MPEHALRGGVAATPASGTQHTLRAGGYRAVVASVGATVRSVSHGGRDLVVPFDAERLRPAMSGALLAPWTNRLRDGRYDFGGSTHQLPVTETTTWTATHGLVSLLDFDVSDKSSARLDLVGFIEPRDGYPWRIRLDVTFSLGPEGLRQRISATNESFSAAPFGMGVHPYVLAAPIAVDCIDDWRLVMSAREVQLVTPDRLLPYGPSSVVDPRSVDLDFSAGRTIGATPINHAFGALDRDSQGHALLRLTDASGEGVELGMDAGFRWVQIYTTDFSEPIARRGALAIEPMTSPPDAFNSRQDLLVLEPAAAATAQWWIRAISGS